MVASEATYFAFGEDDGVLILEAPDNTAAAAAFGLAVAAGGAVKSDTTTPYRISQGRVAGGTIVEVLGTNWDHLGCCNTLQHLGVLDASAPRSGA